MIYYDLRKSSFQNIQKSNFKGKSGGLIHNFNADNKVVGYHVVIIIITITTTIIIRNNTWGRQIFKGCERFQLQRTIADLLYSCNKYGFQEEKEDPRNLSNHHHLIGF